MSDFSLSWGIIGYSVTSQTHRCQDVIIFLIVFIDFEYEITKLQITIVITLQTMPPRDTRKQQQQKEKRMTK